MISTKHIAKAIYESAKDKNGDELSRVLGSAVEFLAKKGLLSRSREILKYLTEIQATDQNIVNAKIKTFATLPEKTAHELREILKNRYKAKDIVLESQEDKSLIGGIRIEAKDEIIDLSLKNKVDQLQNYLLTN